MLSDHRRQIREFLFDFRCARMGLLESSHEQQKYMNPNTTADLKKFLVPETGTEEPGEAAALDLGDWGSKPLLLVLRVKEIIEQESLHVSVWGSVDGKDWGQKPLFLFPQVFYEGATPAALDLALRPEIKFLQARWDVNRWGRGYPRPRFAFSVEVQELNG